MNRDLLNLLAYREYRKWYGHIMCVILMSLAGCLCLVCTLVAMVMNQVEQANVRSQHGERRYL